MPGTMVEFPTNGRTTEGYLATPASGNGPGVLVIQEWWGLVRHIKNVCDRFAAEGFTALAPDMYHGKTARRAGRRGQAVHGAQHRPGGEGSGAAPRAISPATHRRAKLGAVGFCMGGQLALFAGYARTRPSARSWTSTASTRT